MSVAMRDENSQYHHGSRDREKSKGRAKWGAVFDEFSRSTTLHGLRYISDTTTFPARRLTWLVLTLLCTGILAYQIVDRVAYFYSSPITVNFRVNYNQSLSFPTVTICNQNAFRATSASAHGWYRLVEFMYRNGSQTGNDAWGSISGGNLTIDELFIQLGHKKEDFIIRCEWAGHECTAENFTETLTDHGVCYSFNKMAAGDPVLNVSSSGVEHGLRLTLNVEQYEAMPGPHDATGIKILATDQSDFPRVDEVGNAISTGAHAFVGLSVLVINNLPEPHGDCGDRELFSTRRYTTEVCTLECITKFVVNRCGCRHFYMPNMNGDIPVCTVRQYFQCYIEAYEYIHMRTVTFCDCPTYCHYRLFEPSISYASTSENLKHHLMNIAKSKELKDRFYEARETTNRMDENIHSEFNRNVQQTSQALDSLRTILIYEIHERLTTQINRLQEVTYNMTQALKKKNEIYEYQQYNLQKNFMRARDAMEERTLNKLCLGFHEHVFDTEFKLRSLRDSKRNGTGDPDMLYLLLKNVLNSKAETATRGYANYTQLYSAYETGQNIFNYKFRKLPRSGNPHIVPRPLLNESLRHNSYAKRYAPRVGQDIQRVLNATLEFELLVDECYIEVTCGVDFLRMHTISEEFIDSCEDFFHSKSTFYFESINRPLRILKDRTNHFENLQTAYVQCRESLQTALESLNDSLRHIRERFLSDLINNVELAKDYFDENSLRNVTKLELADAFTANEVGNQLHTMKLFFNDLRQRGNFIFEKWSELKERCLKIWHVILNDEDSIEYYQYKKIVEFLQNFTELEASLEDHLSTVRDDNDLRFVIGNIDNIFLNVIEALISELKAFLESMQMDESFIKDNFVRLDVYFKELRHEQIDQQRAYSTIALLCDIGGAMGLFLGASAMTVFEILDFFANRTAVKVSRHRRKKKKEQYSLNTMAA